MGLIKWQDEDIFPGYRIFPGRFGSIFNDIESNIDSVPSVNIKEKNDRYILEVAAPGMAKDKFDVSVDNNVLTISADKEEEKEEKDEELKWTRREFSYSSFKRSFQLPESVKADDVDASYKDGVLCVVIPKKEESKVKAAKRVNIK